MKDYYVYLHKDLNGVVFYVGKGRNNRYKDSSNRGKACEVRAKDGYSSEFYSKNMDESSALILETKLIRELAGLVNSSTATKLPFLQSDYNEYFSLDIEAPSGLSRINTVWTGTYLKGELGDTGYISKRNGKEYWRLKFKNKTVMIHRIIWTLVNGEIPDNYIIDHIDGNGLNNKIENLRLITKSLNCRNKTISKKNKSGVNGIYLMDNRYRAIVSLNDSKKKSKSFSISKYGEAEAFRLACEWRKEQIRLLNEQGAGYTDRHGT